MIIRLQESRSSFCRLSKHTTKQMVRKRSTLPRISLRTITTAIECTPSTKRASEKLLSEKSLLEQKRPQVSLQPCLRELQNSLRLTPTCYLQWYYLSAVNPDFSKAPAARGTCGRASRPEATNSENFMESSGRRYRMLRSGTVSAGRRRLAARESTEEFPRNHTFVPRPIPGH